MTAFAPTDPAAPGMFSVLQFGAARDGRTLTTQAFLDAIDAAAAAGGGTVYVPPGRYLTGTIVLRSRVELHLDAGATILGSQDPADYPIVATRWEGLDVEAHAGLITGAGLEHVAITGQGVIDGRGEPWWQWHLQHRLLRPRPRLIELTRCRHVRIQGVTLQNSPAWTINPTFCENVLVDGVTIVNPPDSPNTDGVNPDSCRNVRITHCYIDVGDDCVTIKAGKEGRSTSGPCENIVVSHCTMVRGHGGVVIGSEMSGGVRSVLVSNCVFEGTDRGIRIKTRRGRGGTVEDIRVSNVMMRRVSCPLTINAYYRCGIEDEHRAYASDQSPLPVDARTPRVRNIHLSQVTAREIVGPASGFLLGLPEMPIEDVTLDDVVLDAAPLDPDAAEPAMALGRLPETDGEFYAQHVRRLRLRNVSLTGRGDRRLWVRDAEAVDLDGVTVSDNRLNRPIRFEQAQGVAARGCRFGSNGHPLPIDADATCAGLRTDGTATLDGQAAARDDGRRHVEAMERR